FPDGHAAFDQRPHDLPLIRPLIFEGDADLIFRRTAEGDDPVDAPEDRTDPRIGGSGGTSGDTKLNRLIRCRERRSDNK
ncbi:MAG: hypothetical protein KKF28_03350, partial [Proteobacteria bacterium]|nr:hypothetical protein [Pseudomonadota bacterium]